MTHSDDSKPSVSRTAPSTGQDLWARRDGPRRATVLHPDTGAAFARITMDENGTPRFDVLDPVTGDATERSPCTTICPKGCNGDFDRATSCALACSAKMIA